MAVLAAEAFKPALQILQQALRLLAFAGDLFAVGSQLIALGIQGALDAAVHRAFALA